MKLSNALYDALHGTQEEIHVDIEIMTMMEDEMIPSRVLLHTITNELTGEDVIALGAL